MRVIILPGKAKFKDFTKAMAGLQKVKIVGILNGDENLKKEWDPQKTGIETWALRDLYRKNIGQDKSSEGIDYNEYHSILKRILNDPRCYYLMDRVFKHKKEATVFNQTVKIEKIVWNTLIILNKVKPNRIVIPSTPHTLTWYFARTAELYGIEIFITPYSSLPWKRWVVKGIDKQEPIEINFKNNDINEFKVKKYIKKIKSKYIEAIPDYEKNRLLKYNKSEKSIVGDLKNVVFNAKNFKDALIRIRSSIRKKNSLNLYIRLSENFYVPDKFIVFFLHYQPERTTLPEGKRFTQQWLAIRALSEALPKDWKLVVKEHPSMFRNKFSKRVRDEFFYHSIFELKNTLIAPLRIDSFSLIDKAIATATITGTSGIESIIRGKPVLVFGAAQYRKMKGVFEVENISEIKEALNRIKHFQHNEEELYKYFEWVDRNSFNKDDDIKDHSIKALNVALSH